MASTSGVGTSTPTDSSQVDFAQKSGYQSLTTEDFVKLLVTQLQNQNPMDPMKDSDLTQQVSAIQSLNSTTQLISTLDTFGQNQSLGAASSLIGREITGKVDTKDVTGVADKAVVDSGKVYVMVGDSKVPFDSITSVGPASSTSTDNSSASTLSKLLSSLTGNSATNNSTDGSNSTDQLDQLLSSMQQNQANPSSTGSNSGNSDTGVTEDDAASALQSMATTGGST